MAGVLLLTDGNATDLPEESRDWKQLPPVYPVAIGPVRPAVFAELTARVVAEAREKGIEKPVVASLAGDTEVEEASQYLIHEQSVCCVPWDDAGPYLRFSVTYLARDEAEEDALMAETVQRLRGMSLRF